MICVRDVRYQYQITQVPKNEIGDKQMKKLLGIVFLIAAATVVYFGSVGWPSLDVNLWSLIPVGLFLFFTLENLLKKDYKASLMCLIIAFIIANANFEPFANFKWSSNWCRRPSLCRYWLSISG